MKAYGLEVKAPTGHRSITFPESSDLKSFSTYVPTCMSLPLPVVPKSSTPATSLANLQMSTRQCPYLSMNFNIIFKNILLFVCFKINNVLKYQLKIARLRSFIIINVKYL